MRILFLTLLFFSPLLAEDQTPSSYKEAYEEAEKKEAPSYETQLIKMFVWLFVLIIFLLIIVWLIRRFSQGRFRYMNNQKRIKIIESRPLSQKSVLYIIEVDGKEIVLSESQLEVRKLSGNDAPVKSH